MPDELRDKVSRRYASAPREGKERQRARSWSRALAGAGVLAAIGVIAAFVILT